MVFWKKRKGMIAIDELLKWLLGLMIFVVIVVSIIYMSKSEMGAIEYIKNMFRFK